MMKELLPCLLFSYCIFTDFLAPHDSTLFFAYYNSYWVKITKKSHFQLFLEGELKFVNFEMFRQKIRQIIGNSVHFT